MIKEGCGRGVNLHIDKSHFNIVNYPFYGNLEDLALIFQ